MGSICPADKLYENPKKTGLDISCTFEKDIAAREPQETKTRPRVIDQNVEIKSTLQKQENDPKTTLNVLEFSFKHPQEKNVEVTSKIPRLSQSFDKAIESLQEPEQPQPIPIAMLKYGEFYDIKSIDQNSRYLAALLLEQLPNNSAKLLLLSSSDFDRFTLLDSQIVLRWRALQIETVQLGIVYPYQVFSKPPINILQWPNNYEGDELIDMITEDMYRAVRESHWVLNLPHFCEGYLHIYLSYICRKDNCPRRAELVDLWFDFMGSYFSVLRDHIRKIKLLPSEITSDLLKSLKGMDQLSERSWELVPNSSSREKEMKLTSTKKSFFDSYRPIELSSAKFDGLWVHILQEYHQDLISWQMQEPLSLLYLFRLSPKLTEILSCYRYLVKDIMSVNFPELHPKESTRLKFRITIATDSFDKAEILLRQSEVSPNELCQIILEEELVDLIMRSSSQTLKTFVRTRTELFPPVLACLYGSSRPDIKLFKLLECLTARIALEDWACISFVVKQRVVAYLYISMNENPVKTYILLKRLVGVALQHKMSPKLLINLFPCKNYSEFMFPAFINGFTLARSQQVMLTYFGSEQRCIDIAREMVGTSHGQLSEYLQGEKLDLWYVFGGSVQIQFCG